MFDCRYDRRKYHEEFLNIFFTYYDKESHFETQEEADKWALYCAEKALEDFKEKYPYFDLELEDWWDIINTDLQEPSACPACGEQQRKFIYFALPGQICKDAECATVTGLAPWVANIFFNGMIYVYTGSYWLALWEWLFSSDLGDPSDYN